MINGIQRLALDLGEPLRLPNISGKTGSEHVHGAFDVCLVPVPDDAPTPALHHREHGAPSRTWRYLDAASRPIGFIARYDPPGQRKQFCPHTLWRVDGRLKWRKAKWPGSQPLYGLDKLNSSPIAPVIVCEGEKAADAAQKVFPNSVVITSPGGARAAKAADWTPLASRQVIIWPDNDAAGLGYALDVKRELATVGARTVTTVDAMRVAAALPSGEERQPPEGWDAADALDQDGWLPEALAARVLQHIDHVEAGINPASVAKWPSGFSMRGSGLWFDAEGDEPPLRLSGPFTVPGLARDPNGAGWATTIEWQDRDGLRHRAFVSHADLVGDGTEWLRPLVDAGLSVTIGRKALSLLKRGLFDLDCGRRVRLVKRSGWYGTAFVLPKMTIGATGPEEVLFDGRVDVARYAEAGTLEEWVETVAAPAAGNSRLILALSVAFAGPIADLLQDEGGGVNIKGSSSTGKSTGLIAAGSVWGGGGRAGFTQTWRATGNGLESVARAHSGTVLVLDELGELEAREAGATAYLLINGQGKARATKEAELRARLEWRVMLLSAGEIGLADKIAETGKRAHAGQLIRVVDVPADAGCGLGLFEYTKGVDPAEFSKAVKGSALRHYGTAGPAFVSALVDDPDGAATAARVMMAETVSKLLADVPETDGQCSRAAERFALIATAGEMARVTLQLPWAEGEVEQALRKCFNAWRATRGGDGPGELLTAKEAIRGAIERHGESRFRNLENPSPSSSPIRDLLGYRVRRDDALLYAFTATGWGEVLTGAVDPKSAVDMLFERGLLQAGRDRTHRLFLKVDGRSVPTYAVRASALFDVEVQ